MERHLVQTACGYVHLRTAGEASAAPTVVLLHQSPSSGRMWLDVMRELAPGIRTCAVDLLGYGDSDMPSEQLTLEEHADLVAAAVRRVVAGPVVLVGHHTGAVVAAHLAASETGWVQGLLLSGYPLYPDWRAKLARLGPVLRPVSVERDGAGLDEIWRHVTGPLEPDPDPEVALTIMADRLRAGSLWFTGYVQLLGADLSRILDDAAEAVRGRPTVVVSADADPIEAYAAEVARRFGVDVTRIQGTSWVSFEHPERVAEPIDELVRRVRAELTEVTDA